MATETLTIDQQKELALAQAKRKRAESEGTSGETISEKRNYALSEVPGAIIRNAPQSGLNLGIGIASTLAKPVIAAGKAVVHPVQTAESIGTAITHPISTTQEGLTKLIKTAKTIGGVYAERYGSYENAKRTIAEDPVGAAADISMLLTGGGTAAEKLGITGASTVTKAGNVINPFTYVAKGGNLVGKGISSVAKSVYKIPDPKSNAYLEAVEGQGPAVVNALNKAEEFVPGFNPTAAQAAAVEGLPTKFQSLGKAAEKKLPTESRARTTAQKEALFKEVGKVGKTESALAKAETIRDKTANELYGIARKDKVKTDSTFENLLSRPSMSNVMRRAAQLAAEKDEPFTIGKTQKVTTEASSIVDKSGNPFIKEIPATTAKIPGSSIHYIKKAFDDLIQDPATFGIGKSEAEAIAGTRGEFLKWAEGKSPAYKAARETFAEQSGPINQMKVGQYLESKLTPAMGEDTAKLRANAYVTALENAPSVVKNALTGVPRTTKLEKLLTPIQLKQLSNVRKELERNARSESMAADAGSNSLERVLGEPYKPAHLPNLLSRTAAIANTIMNRVSGKINEKLAIEIATEMLDPKLAAKSINKALERQAKGKRLAKPFKKIGKALNRYNTLTPLQQVSNALNESENN